MEVLVLNTSFETIAIIDKFESLIWTDRYCGCGDFEIYAAANDKLFENTPQDYYLWFRESEHMMIIEEKIITSDVESGNHLKVVGRSLESILDRRIVWKQTVLKGDFQTAIKKLINENIISPSISARKIPNFIFEASTDPVITELTIDAQFTGDTLYDAIKSLCEDHAIGFKITLNESNQFVFKLYAGADRSYDQTENPYVVFSPNFENIINSNYYENKQPLKNVALVAGEGEGNARKTATVGSGSGLSRRELYVDARDISTETDEGKLTNSQYTAQLKQRGKEKLAENIFTKTFDGEVEASRMFVYGQDFFLGDVVQIVNEYGIAGKSRVDEMIISEDINGSSAIPTFNAIETDNE